MNTHLKPARAILPGRIILRELDARGWTQKDLATITKRPEQTISLIVNGRKKITPATALQLAAAFDTSANLWLNLETNYRIHEARQTYNTADIARRSRLHRVVPLNELIKRGWIVAQDSLSALENEVRQFLGVVTLEDAPVIAANFRQSSARDPETIAEVAWLKRVEHLAQAQNVGMYDATQLEAALPQLLKLAHQVENIAQIPPFLLNLGVHFLIVPHLPHTYIDGSTFMLAGHPVIALTLRYDRIDNFWFTLMHELAHIIAEHQGLYLDNFEAEIVDDTEKEANRLAQSWLIDEQDLAQFISATQPYFSHTKLNAFAAQQNRHTGIIVGRLHHDGLLAPRHSRKFLVKVSPHLSDWVDISKSSIVGR